MKLAWSVSREVGREPETCSDHSGAGDSGLARINCCRFERTQVRFVHLGSEDFETKQPQRQALVPWVEYRHPNGDGEARVASVRMAAIGRPVHRRNTSNRC